jgi:histone-lysine N-methyltransferase MLL1
MCGIRVVLLQPNSYSKIIQVEGEKKIVIFACRPLFRGEEVTYDYKFPFEEEKIPCRCGAANCRGRMN